MERCEGLIIRVMDYRESDKIIRLYTKEHGKISLVARGAKKSNSRIAAVTQLFTYGEFMYFGNKGLGTIQQGEVIERFPLISQDIFTTAYASYCVDLLDKAIEEREPNPALFSLIYQVIEKMAAGENAHVISQIFELKMLNVLGHYPEFRGCVLTGETEGPFDFSIKHNGLISRRCFDEDPNRLQLSDKVIRLLRLYYLIDFNRLGKIDVNDEVTKQVQWAIDTYYNEVSGLNLKTKRFLNQMSDWGSQMKVDTSEAAPPE
ncbi:DNA repair protein RecO [Brochothrix campestris]|uniref:DNA repair protein RecO n=1 Tax=Brochothrix campestris FSL F6-1037 TaxID=1265861 RepID=W7CYM6_9LIST|nr:DNA repair protein RecO [Brochothrix campestris]EUJ42057.1 DNA repair protein RecO [Brochothrix campestris FSL F6-1037]